MIAYIILAHKNIEQLKRLINQLNTIDTIAIIHIDKKVSCKELNALKKYYKNNNNIFFMTKRYNCVWGDFSIVQATNSCIEFLLKLNKDFTHCILMSGMDFPIKSNKYIKEFFTNNKNINFIEGSLNNKYTDTSKYNLFYFKYAHLFMNDKIHRLIFRLQYKLSYMLKIKRKHPLFKNIYFGSQWWALTQKTLIKINEFMKNNKDYLNFYKNTNIPDEFFYQTIIMNLFDYNIPSDNLHYTEWEKDSWHPNTLTMNHINKIKDSNKLFARKFDINIDEDIISYLENTLSNN